jgi:hypothetical protein
MLLDWGSPSEVYTGRGTVNVVELQGKWVSVREFPGMGSLTWAQGQEGLYY